MKLDRTIGTGKPRAGKEHRNNPERLFQVRSVGWYVHTREGLNGPFAERQDAEDHIGKLVQRPRSRTGFVSTVEL